MQKQIIAHRGASKQEHENTLNAFIAAVRLGSDAVELDVRRTSDGVLAVFHDPKIANKPISRLKFSELNKFARTQNFIVPTLSEVLAAMAGKAKIYIEIKGQGFELEVIEIAQKFLRSSQFKVICFNFQVLKKIKIKYPKIQVGFLVQSNSRLSLANKNEILSTVNFLLIRYGLWRTGFARILPKNYPIIVWTVDDPKKINLLLHDQNVQGIITNLPDVALKLRPA